LVAVSTNSAARRCAGHSSSPRRTSRISSAEGIATGNSGNRASSTLANPSTETSPAPIAANASGPSSTGATPDQRKRQRPHPPQRRQEHQPRHLIRRNVGKSTNLATYTANDLRAIEHRINTMPRRSLHWSTAHNVYTAAVAMTG